MSVLSAGTDYDHNPGIESYDEEDGQSGQDGVQDEEQMMQDYAIDNFLRPLVINDGTYYQLACRFSKLYGELARTSDQQFLPTPVTRLPSGQETGRYLAIDVGGTNLRVAFIDLLGEAADKVNNTDPTTKSEKSRDTLLKAQQHRVHRTLEKVWPIGEHLKMDKAEDLFLWIGDCMAEVVANSLAMDSADGKEIPEELEMGITFSFPMMYVNEAMKIDSFPFPFIFLLLLFPSFEQLVCLLPL